MPKFFTPQVGDNIRLVHPVDSKNFWKVRTIHAVRSRDFIMIDDEWSKSYCDIPKKECFETTSSGFRIHDDYESTIIEREATPEETEQHKNNLAAAVKRHEERLEMENSLVVQGTQCEDIWPIINAKLPKIERPKGFRTVRLENWETKVFKVKTWRNYLEYEFVK